MVNPKQSPAPINPELFFYWDSVFPCIGLARERCKWHGHFKGEAFFQKLHEELEKVIQETGDYNLNIQSTDSKTWKRGEK